MNGGYSGGRVTVSIAETDQALEIAEYFTRNKTSFTKHEPYFTDICLDEEYWMQRLFFQKLTGSDLFLAVKAAGSENVIGLISFYQFTMHPVYTCYTGFSLDAEFQGKGFMREALQLAIKFVFSEKKVHKVMALCSVGNKKSYRLLRSMGFSREGLLKNHVFENNKWSDALLMAVINKEMSFSDIDPSPSL